MWYTGVTMQNDSDEKLAALHLSGDEEAFPLLMRKYLTAIYNFAAQFVGYGQNAEDVAQETFIKVWKNLKKFNPAKKFKPWLFRIARNSAIDYLRQRKLTIPLPGVHDDEENGSAADLADPAPLPPEQATSLETKKAVRKIIEALPPIYGTMLKLYYLEEFSLPEIAKILAQPIDTVKSRHRRALIKIRQLISQDSTLLS